MQKTILRVIPDQDLWWIRRDDEPSDHFKTKAGALEVARRLARYAQEDEFDVELWIHHENGRVESIPVG